MAKKFDLHFEPLTQEEQRSSLKLVGFGAKGSRGVKGLQMLINQWLKCFLTRRGSDPTALDYGTDFTSLIGSNLSASNARDVSVIAVDQCNEQLFRMQGRDQTLTSTERLASAEIVRFQVDAAGPGISMWVEIRNQAGERLMVQLPTAALSE